MNYADLCGWRAPHHTSSLITPIVQFMRLQLVLEAFVVATPDVEHFSRSQWLCPRISGAVFPLYGYAPESALAHHLGTIR